MALSKCSIRQAYNLILGRDPSESELAKAAEQHEEIDTLRTTFLSSTEFERKYDRLRKQLETSRPSTLVHLHIPQTGSAALAQALAQSAVLQPNMTIDGQSLDALRNLPRPKRQALRYIHSHMGQGVGDALGFPHRYMCLIRRPGPRILGFYQFIRETRTHPFHEVVNARQMSFGDYLEFSVENLPHRIELDNGQIRRLAGGRDYTCLGHEAGLLKTALHTVLTPGMLLGFTEEIEIFLEEMVSEGYLDDTEIENLNTSPMPEHDQGSLDVLTPEQREIFDSYTAWDGYFYEVCQHLFSEMT